MVTQETKRVNKKNIKLQEEMNRGWTFGPITVILVILLLILFIVSFGFGFGLWEYNCSVKI